jgi:hypothetical protein
MSPPRQNVRVYFDNNVYSRIEAEGSADTLKGWLKDTGATLRVSDTLMTEAFRISDPATRARRFEVITTLATEYPRPGLFLSTRELVAAIQRHRSTWLRRKPDTDFISRFLNLDRNTWRRLRADPAYVPEGLEKPIGILHGLLGEVRDGQRKTRRRLRASGTPLTEALDPSGADQYWRTAAALQVVRLLFADEALRPYARLLLAYLDKAMITPADFASFFKDEVEDVELPRHRISGIADYFQRRYEVTTGNFMDLGHATEMLEVDVVFTRDTTFHKVLEDVAKHLPVRGAPVLLSSQAPVVEQLEAVKLGAARAG